MTRAAVGGCRGAMLALALTAVALAAGRADEAIPVEVEALTASDAAAAGPGDVTVQVSRGPSGLHVEGRCVVQAPAAVAWQVLTDYDGIDGFVSSMKESRVTGRGVDHVLVEQVAVGRLFLFSRRFRATLFVEETPPTRITFEDVLGTDFESYRGEWRIEEQAGRVTIVYQVGAKPSRSVPDFIARGVFGRTARELLSQVRDEIERRAPPTD
jgi:ribosome-associated toxin RatA of RatAB toxin-antitoxin module